MKNKLLYVLVFLLFSSNLLIAKKLRHFGDEVTIHYLESTNVTDNNGKELFLGYKTSTVSFFLPLYIKDQGYVLGYVENSGKTYFEFNQIQDDIKKFKNNGLLPKTLPRYNISFFDHPIIIIISMLIFLLMAINLYFKIKNKSSSDKNKINDDIVNEVDISDKLQKVDDVKSQKVDISIEEKVDTSDGLQEKPRKKIFWFTWIFFIVSVIVLFATILITVDFFGYTELNIKLSNFEYIHQVCFALLFFSGSILLLKKKLLAIKLLFIFFIAETIWTIYLYIQDILNEVFSLDYFILLDIATILYFVFILYSIDKMRKQGLLS